MLEHILLHFFHPHLLLDIHKHKLKKQNMDMMMIIITIQNFIHHLMKTMMATSQKILIFSTSIN
jgi:accessory gene regulator protein AgrB